MYVYFTLPLILIGVGYAAWRWVGGEPKPKPAEEPSLAEMRRDLTAMKWLAGLSLFLNYLILIKITAR